MRTFRLLETGHNTAFMNMAIDEAVMLKQGEVPPTIRLYGWKPAAVSIGYFQSLEEEIDLGKCSEHSVDYIRRVTGGGAVFHEDEVTYSFITKESDELVPREIMASYKLICGGIIKGLSNLGIDAGFVPLNDIVANGKKISGNAQTRRNNCVLQHGTIIMKVDVEKMFSLLKVPSEKIRDKLIQNVKERVTSVSDVLGKEVSFGDMSSSLARGFEESLNIKLVKGELTKEERELAEELAETKYSTKEWNHKR